MAYLIIHPPNQPRFRTMLRGSTVIGRAFGSTIWIDDPRLSRKHCIIESQDDQWLLTDQQSSNGTYVNGRRVADKVLTAGDTIEVGKVRIEFQPGSFVEHRPADPIDAASMGMGKIPLERPDPSNSTIIADPLSRRPFPVPQPERAQPQLVKKPAVPLAFGRPPARPIVKTES